MAREAAPRKCPNSGLPRAGPCTRFRRLTYCNPIGDVIGSLLETNMKEQSDVWQGTLSLMVLRTLNLLGPQHGYGIARRIEQTSENLLAINHGTLYPVLLKLEQEGSIAAEWGVSENNRKAKFYRITRIGKKELAEEEREWQRATEIMARFSRNGDEAV
jgi:PadR family transcriptional regulator, regulatory protein PadR